MIGRVEILERALVAVGCIVVAAVVAVFEGDRTARKLATYRANRWRAACSLLLLTPESPQPDNSTAAAKQVANPTGPVERLTAKV